MTSTTTLCCEPKISELLPSELMPKALPLTVATVFEVSTCQRESGVASSIIFDQTFPKDRVAITSNLPEFLSYSALFMVNRVLGLTLKTEPSKKWIDAFPLLSVSKTLPSATTSPVANSFFDSVPPLFSIKKVFPDKTSIHPPFTTGSSISLFGPILLVELNPLKSNPEIMIIATKVNKIYILFILSFYHKYQDKVSARSAII